MTKKNNNKSKQQSNAQAEQKSGKPVTSKVPAQKNTSQQDYLRTIRTAILGPNKEASFEERRSRIYQMTPHVQWMNDREEGIADMGKGAVKLNKLTYDRIIQHFNLSDRIIIDLCHDGLNYVGTRFMGDTGQALSVWSPDYRDQLAHFIDEQVRHSCSPGEENEKRPGPLLIVNPPWENAIQNFNNNAIWTDYAAFSTLLAHWFPTCTILLLHNACTYTDVASFHGLEPGQLVNELLNDSGLLIGQAVCHGAVWESPTTSSADAFQARGVEPDLAMWLLLKDKTVAPKPPTNAQHSLAVHFSNFNVQEPEIIDIPYRQYIIEDTANITNNIHLQATRVGADLQLGGMSAFGGRRSILTCRAGVHERALKGLLKESFALNLQWVEDASILSPTGVSLCGEDKPTHLVLTARDPKFTIKLGNVKAEAARLFGDSLLAVIPKNCRSQKNEDIPRHDLEVSKLHVVLRGSIPALFWSAQNKKAVWHVRNGVGQSITVGDGVDGVPELVSPTGSTIQVSGFVTGTDRRGRTHLVEDINGCRALEESYDGEIGIYTLEYALQRNIGVQWYVKLGVNRLRVTLLSQGSCNIPPPPPVGTSEGVPESHGPR